MKSKKGQISSLQGIIVTLIVVAVIIATGFFVIQEFFEQDAFVDTSGSVNNETGFYLNGTIYTVDMATASGFNTFAIVQVMNSSSNETIGSGNYTIDSDEGTIVNASAWGDDEVYVSYTYLYGESGYIGLNDTLDAMSTVPELLPLIILIVMIGLVLVVVFNVIPGSRSLGA
jgi:uncharacterized protein (UPF0333 family)